VFVATSPFDSQNPQYSNSATTVFAKPTNNAAELIHAAHHGLKRIFKPGFSYQRAGVILPDLLPAGVVQTSLFDLEENANQSNELMATLDNINQRYGKKSIHYASEIISKRWHMRQQFKSPSYTTKWAELFTINI
jgi:DNA polymerase V